MKKFYQVPEFVAKEIDETKIMDGSNTVMPLNNDVEIDVSELGNQ